ncbi:hypothetical protein HDE_10995 [Halotydeus destructor]|nr:hypothetical protein HDE_10995 [Halotydeus destructor]
MTQLPTELVLFEPHSPKFAIEYLDELLDQIGEILGTEGFSDLMDAVTKPGFIVTEAKKENDVSNYRGNSRHHKMAHLDTGFISLNSLVMNPELRPEIKHKVIFIPDPYLDKVISPGKLVGISDLEIIDILKRYAKKTKGLTVGDVDRISIENVEQTMVYHYRLETQSYTLFQKDFIEPAVMGPRKVTGWSPAVVKPFKNYTNPVKIEPFTSQQIRFEVPFSAKVTVCPKDNKACFVRCARCHLSNHSADITNCPKCKGLLCGVCPLCYGQGVVRKFSQIHFATRNQQDNFVVNKSTLSSNVAVRGRSRSVVKEQRNKLRPIALFCDATIVDSSIRFWTSQLENIVEGESLLRQRQQLRAIPVVTVTCKWNRQPSDHVFYILGTERKVVQFNAKQLKKGTSQLCLVM